MLPWRRCTWNFGQVRCFFVFDTCIPDAHYLFLVIETTIVRKLIQVCRRTSSNVHFANFRMPSIMPWTCMANGLCSLIQKDKLRDTCGIDCDTRGIGRKNTLLPGEGVSYGTKRSVITFIIEYVLFWSVIRRALFSWPPFQSRCPKNGFVLRFATRLRCTHRVLLTHDCFLFAMYFGLTEVQV